MKKCLYMLLLACAFLLTAMSTVAMVNADAAYPTLQYDAQRTGNVTGIAPETASLLWQSGEKTAGCIGAGPIVSDGKVYISTWWSWMGGGGNAVDALYCLDAASGEEIWNNTEVYGASTAAVADNKLFVGTHSGNITCVDATTGEILWSKKIEENPSWFGVASSPLVIDDKVYVLTFSDGTLHAFSFNGTELWNFSSGGKIFCYSSPAAYEDKIFFAGNNSGQHALYCLNVSTHEVVWKFTTETEIRGSPTIWAEEGMVFFTTEYVRGKARGLYAVDITTGEEVWNVSHYASWASPAVSNGKVFIGGSAVDTTFYCYDATDGSLIWKNEEMGGAIDSSPVVADGKVYFGTNEVNGTVYALDADNGSIFWSYTLYIPPRFGGGFNIMSHPAISDRTLFIGVDNVGVLAFRDPQVVLFDGTVTLTSGTTFSFVPSNDPFASYEVNSTTDLGALVATGLAFNASDIWYAAFGSFFLESIAGIENEVWPNNTWAIYINDAPAPKGLGANELKDGDNVKFYFCPADPATFAFQIEDASYVVNISVTVLPAPKIFDTYTPECPYPSISGRHYGTITPAHDIYVTALFTRACEGTGGHTKYVRIWNDTWNGVEGRWQGYTGDWHTIPFDDAFMLAEGETYYYIIETGSYPQMHHKSVLNVSGGTITSTKFIDVNGRVYNDRIPAIRLE